MNLPYCDHYLLILFPPNFVSIRTSSSCSKEPVPKAAAGKPGRYEHESRKNFRYAPNHAMQNRADMHDFRHMVAWDFNIT